MSNLLKQPVVVDNLPKSSGKRGAKSMYLNEDAITLALHNKNKWIHCYSFQSSEGVERRKKGASMRIAGKTVTERQNSVSDYYYWQYKVVTVDDTVNLYVICEDRSGTDWQ